MPLSFHAVSFGQPFNSAKLRRMVEVAQEVEKSAPRNSLTNSIASSYTEALDTVKFFRGVFHLQNLKRISLDPSNRDIPRVR